MSQNKIEKLEVGSYYKNNSGLLQDILNIVNEFIKGFQKKTSLQFLYEADIQTNLSYELAKAIGYLELTLYRTGLSPANEKLSLITREYPVASKSSQGRFDIACINPEMIDQYFKWRLEINENKPVGANTIFWELPLLAGIEIKYSIIGYDPGISGIQKDVEKSKSYKTDYHEKRHNKDGQYTFTKAFQYLALQFFQDEVWFSELIKTNQTQFQQVNEINHFDCVYLVGKNGIFKSQMTEK